MTTGTIKRLVEDNGFGFIAGNDGTEYFFYRSAVENRAFDELQEGERVEFEPEPVAPKGPRARLPSAPNPRRPVGQPPRVVPHDRPRERHRYGADAAGDGR